MAGDLILITGGTGFIGIKTIQLTLIAGYTVRAAVRSQEKASEVLATPTAVKGVKYILHLASPVMKEGGFTPSEFETHLIQPAVRGTTAILSAAYKTEGIKRIVTTSSVLAITPWEDFIAKESDTVFDDTYQIPFPAGPYQSAFEAYAASKVAALLATKEFIKGKHPEWGVINILPSFVVGDNEMITEADKINSGTASAAFAQILGRDSRWRAVPGSSVHVADVAKLHVEALDPNIEGDQSFLGVSDGERGTVWEDAIDIVNRNFPEAVKRGVLPNNGIEKTKRTKFDATRTEKAFGFKFLGYEEQVKSVVRQYLGLKGEVVG